MTGLLINPKSSERLSCFENGVVVYMGHEIIHRDAVWFFWNQFCGEVWSSSSEEPQKI